jgi:hypothetical protein
MWVWVDRLSLLVFDASLSAATLLSLVAVLMLACRQPARRIRLARAAIICSLFIIPMIVFVPLPRFEPLAALRSAGFFLPPEAGGGELVSSPGASGESEYSPEVIPGPSWRIHWPFSTLRTIRFLTAFYLCGLAVGLALFVLGCWGVVWLTSRSHAPSASSLALYSSLPFVREARRPALRVATRIRRPVLLGTFRQTILIPIDLDSPDASAQLKLSLLHELAHSEGADHWFSVAGSLAQALWFFLPPLWWIRAQMRLDHEFLADRRAAGGFGPLRTYASSLLDLANPESDANRAQAPQRPAGDSAGGGGSALFLRMLMLVQCPFRVEHRPPAWWCWALPATVVLAMLASSTLRLRFVDHAAHASNKPASNASTGRQIFRVARLTIPERSPNSHGRTPVFELPMRLPTYFDLSLDVWGDVATIAQTRVVGLPLQLSDPANREVAAPAGWHSVAVSRGRSGISLRIDGHEIVCAADASMTGWLSVEPAPDHPGRFQNLTITW